MLNSNLEEISVGSSVTGNSKISKLTGKYFNIHLKSRKESSSKIEENFEANEKMKIEGKCESPARNSDFLRNLKKKLQFRKFMPTKSRQKVSEINWN